MLNLAPETPKRRRQLNPARLRWIDDLVQWCIDHRIGGADTAIARWLGINRTTIHRWRKGGPVSKDSRATILEKTHGEIDPWRNRDPRARIAPFLAQAEVRVAQSRRRMHSAQKSGK